MEFCSHKCLSYSLLLHVGLLTTGEIFRFIAFCEKYPFVLGNMMLFSLTSALGQVSDIAMVSFLALTAFEGSPSSANGRVKMDLFPKWRWLQSPHLWCLFPNWTKCYREKLEERWKLAKFEGCLTVSSLPKFYTIRNLYSMTGGVLCMYYNSPVLSLDLLIFETASFVVLLS